MEACRVIWKYPVRIDDKFALEMPKGAQVLAVQTQNGAPQLWALVDPDAEHESRRFALLGTGHYLTPEALEHGLTYRGTFQVRDGALVFHLFEWVPA